MTSYKSFNFLPKSLEISNVVDGIYYACVFTQIKTDELEAYLSASNNGVRLVIDRKRRF